MTIESDRQIYELACGLLEKYKQDDSINLKDEVRKIDANSKTRKKIASLVTNYVFHKVEVKSFKKESKIKCKRHNFNETLIRLMLTEILYSPCFRDSTFQEWPEWTFLNHNFHNQIEEKKNTIVLRKLPEKQEKKRKSNENGSRSQDTKRTAKKLRKQNEDHRDLFRDIKELPVKYLRVNKIKTTIDELVYELVNQLEFIQVGRKFDCFNDFLKKLFDLKENEFMIDYHFPDDLIVVNSDCKKVFQEYRMYREGKIIFQDKASLIPLRSANISRGMRIADICCCPGMKTFGISSTLQNDCEIISVDINSERIEEMKLLMDKLGVKCSKIIERDFMETTIDDFRFDQNNEIDVLFLDPSCSGSGMIDKRGGENELHDGEDRKRLMKLASFQTKLLCHAMSLRPKLIVYSTCSFGVWENEFVVCKAEQQAQNASEYELVNAFPEWPQRGDYHFTCADHVIRAGPSRGCRGFFTAVFKLKI